MSSTASLLKLAQANMDLAVSSLGAQLSKIRTGRPHPSMLDTVMVDSHGATTPLRAVASISLLDDRTLVARPFEKSMASRIEKAIRDSGLGLSPSSDGDAIRIPMPVMSEERRKDMAKRARDLGETSKIAIRNIRREANEAVKALAKSKLATEGEQKSAENRIQICTDKAVASVEQMVAAKTRDIMDH